ncbi:MAG: hypothetical protein EXQ70_10450 [Solirubrobacterales bacterium]|nr:hypothetical protein [Solirubrobacterales bacterium]
MRGGLGGCKRRGNQTYGRNEITKKFVLLAVCALAIGAVVAGCGSDDDSSDETSSDALTKSQFVSQADAICATGNKKLDQAASELGNNPSKGQIEAFASDDAVPTIQAEVDQIGALAAPEGDEDQVDAILTAAQDAVDEIDSDPGSLGGGADTFAEANVQPQGAIVDGLQERPRLANEYGLTACGG